MEGIDIHHIILGSGKTLVFLHGWGGSTASFLGIARALAHHYRCVLVDFAGFGDTPEPTSPYRLEDYTKDLDALLDKLDIKECFFIAHSFGGRVAIDYVTHYHHAEVKGLVLTDSAGMRPRRSLSYYVRVWRYKLYKMLNLNTDNMGSSDYRALSPTMKHTFVNIVNTHQDKIIKEINIPTLLIFGDRDRDTPLYMAKRLHRHIKDSALIIFRGRGHFAYLEEPWRFSKIVDNFVGGL